MFGYGKTNKAAAKFTIDRDAVRAARAAGDARRAAIKAARAA